MYRLFCISKEWNYQCIFCFVSLICGGIEVFHPHGNAQGNNSNWTAKTEREHVQSVWRMFTTMRHWWFVLPSKRHLQVQNLNSCQACFCCILCEYLMFYEMIWLTFKCDITTCHLYHTVLSATNLYVVNNGRLMCKWVITQGWYLIQAMMTTVTDLKLHNYMYYTLSLNLLWTLSYKHYFLPLLSFTNYFNYIIF